MVPTAKKPAEPEVLPFVVLRPICIAGERIEVGQPVELIRALGAELQTAGKVAPGGSPAAEAAIKAAAASQPKSKARTKAAEAEPTTTPPEESSAA